MTLSLRAVRISQTSRPPRFLLEYCPQDVGGLIYKSWCDNGAESSCPHAQGFLAARSTLRLCTEESKKNHSSRVIYDDDAQS